MWSKISKTISITLMLFPLALQAQTGHGDDEIVVKDKEGNEEAIDLPEGMTHDVDSLINLYMAKKYMVEADDCQMRDVNPVFEDEVYKDRLSRIPSVIEMPYNDVVRKFIDLYSGKLRHSVSYMLGASNFYMPIFEEAPQDCGSL